jgi:4-alpha-glucanotransferase
MMSAGRPLFRRFRQNTGPAAPSHATSLSSRCGIGDVGPSAWVWIDRLSEAG